MKKLLLIVASLTLSSTCFAKQENSTFTRYDAEELTRKYFTWLSSKDKEVIDLEPVIRIKNNKPILKKSDLSKLLKVINKSGYVSKDFSSNVKTYYANYKFDLKNTTKKEGIEAIVNGKEVDDFFCSQNIYSQNVANNFKINNLSVSKKKASAMLVVPGQKEMLIPFEFVLDGKSWKISKYCKF